MLLTMQVKDAKEKKNVAKKLSERYLRNAGEYYLARYPASSAHFLQVMTLKIDRSCRDHPEQDREHWITHVKDTLTPYFQELGFLNDELYAQALFQSLKNRGFSKAKIIARLRQKLLPSDMIANLFEDGFDEKEAAHRFAQKKKIGVYRITPYADYQEKQKDLGKMARNGFSYDMAMSVFDN
jgi:SOS response regulatory protein OraA/RecX